MKSKIKNSQTLEQGAMLLVLSGIFVKIIGAFFKIPLSADYCLGDIGFGYFSSVYDIFIPIYTLSSSGFPAAVSRIISEYLVENNKAKALKAFSFFKKIMLIIGIIGTASLFLLAKPFVGLTDKTGKTLFIFLAMAPAVLFCFLSSAYRGYTEGHRNMFPTAVSNLIDALSKVILGFTSAFIAVKLSGNIVLGAVCAMAGITLGTVISFVFLNIYYRKNYNYNENYSVDSRLFKRLIIISLPIVLSSLGVSLVTFIDSLSVRPILSALFERNTIVCEEIIKAFSDDFLRKDLIPTFLYGIRSKAYTVFHLIPVFTGFIAVSVLPNITADFKSNNKENLNKNINSALKISSTISFPISFGLIFIGEQIMNLLYGADSLNIGGNILSIYGIAAVFAGCIMPLTAVLQAVDKQKTALISFIFGLIIKAIGNIVLISVPKLNIYGSAISTVLCFISVFIIHLVSLIKLKDLKMDIKSVFLKPVFSAFLCGITAYLVCKLSDSSLITVASILLAGLVYLTFLIILKVFSLTEIKEIIKKNT